MLPLPAILARGALLGAALLGSVLLPAGQGRAQPEAESIPGLPAEAPPEPARLPPTARPMAPPPPEAPLVLPAGMEALPQGSWRIRFAAGAERPPEAASTTLANLGRRLAAQPEGRVTLQAQASGPAADASAARRLSLARALAVKQALAEGGLPPTRIDLRPLGRTEEAVDAVDVLPPGAERAAAK
ncbi:OmpA family protein [Siccirubricoccus sp. G192]|uniref:OmpA family protein n=1 Tax=Siccirubricoccus sp. G192 TaxID=2849651 RepID=UPI001C2BC2A7|nr:OmpA family protein [Siccirubricoccus sp. G192]MBV1799381.1 hypothetical protein [Siccirubricoccus sp. G192]